MLSHVVLMKAAKTAAWVLPEFGGQETRMFTQVLNFESWLWRAA